jgi:hypothetical protein
LLRDLLDARVAGLAVETGPVRTRAGVTEGLLRVTVHVPPVRVRTYWAWRAPALLHAGGARFAPAPVAWETLDD